ncbi:MAG: hypothetical protein AVDCRST_MAG88-423 [uncultured Thermomicrobiales bacterium]|uniref:histidine kinase n=1 Tax=uncultured Thermomicrobiales bacterium TaxID=1645740 RepID=A0A6J4UBV4_9BACT|nr:MAG: hypothetical protein AVDCRST_MAG88-423 [uncultured Thermomicrobiales bacterium]
MIGRLGRRGADIPLWLPPVVVGMALVAGLLVGVLERGFVRYPASLGVALVAIIVAAWLLEIGGVPWPRPIFVGAVLVPAAGLVYLGRDSFTPLFLILLVVWLAYTGNRRAGVSVLALALASFLLPLFTYATDPEEWVPWCCGIAFGWLAASALVAQQRTLAELRAAQADLARQAAAEERRRIAREIHDVIAHSLAITMLHLTGARHILSRDPQRAADALAQAERLGRQSLADIRRTVGLLGAEGGAGDSAAPPLPGTGDIPRLVDEYARAGLDVRLAISGETTRLSPAAGLDLYRVLQEALTNAVKHAPGARVIVELAIGETALTLRIRDTGPRPSAAPITTAAGAGLGIAGMRERASLLGGSLVAGPAGEGWLVELHVPVGGGAERGA